MTMVLRKTIEPAVPSWDDMATIQATSQALARLSGRECVHVEAKADGEQTQTFILPATAVRLLTDIMSHLAEGRAVSIMPEQAELTTKQAADVLNVSRPFLVHLLREGKLPHHMVGTHRRVMLRDLLQYKKIRAAWSAAAMDQLAEQAQELDMAY